jgi:hypothetical protein
MSEEVKNNPQEILARLRGVGTGGVKPSQTNVQPDNRGVTSDMQDVKPKRDIQELYDFIDAYCNKSDEEQN